MKLSLERQEANKHEESGHFVVFSTKHDSFLCFECRERLLFSACGEVSCHYCWVEVDWDKEYAFFGGEKNE
tara:strand:+ start:638 stop:850 length:213 start_codon:yes stop_codon:yes gene_type:complete